MPKSNFDKGLAETMNLNKIIISLLFFVFASHSYAQLVKRRNVFPIWTFHQKNLNIHGISLGLVSPNEPRNTNTNGIKIEMIGWGFFVPLIPFSPVAKNESALIEMEKEAVSETINGLSLSATGTVCDCNTNGINVGLFGHLNRKVNGITVALMLNMAQRINGIQISGFNDSYYMNGLQLGFVNKSRKTRGLQIGLLNTSEEHWGIQVGLWNVNQRRKLPLINWNFSKKKG